MQQKQFACVRRIVGLAASVVASAVVKLCPLVVVDAADLFVHQPCEDAVDRINNLLVAPEIHLQIDPRSRRGIRRIAVAFAEEKLRTGFTELVDALLDIAHHEEVLASVFDACNRRQKSLLQQIGVLVLIDHDLRKLPAHGDRLLGGIAVLTHQNRKRNVGDGRKVVGICLLLFLHPCVAVVLHKAAEAPKKRHAFLLQGDHLRRHLPSLLGELSDNLFIAFSGLFIVFLPHRVRVGLRRRKPRPCRGLCKLSQKLPVVLRLRNSLHIRKVRGKCILVNGRHVILVNARKVEFHRGKNRLELLSKFCDDSGIIDAAVGIHGLLVPRKHRRKPGFGEGVALAFVGNLPDQLHKIAVSGDAAVSRHEICKHRISALVRCRHHLVEGLLRNQRPFAVIEKPEGRVDIRFMKISPYNGLAETVNR